jgi:hypothetical protein
MSKKSLVIMSVLCFFMLAPSVFAVGIEIPGGTGLSEDSFAQVLDRTLNWMLMIFVILATMAFVITGLQFIFSFGGASGTQEDAKKNLTYTIIAIFVVGGALIILNTVVGLLGDAPAGSTANTGTTTGTLTNSSANTPWASPLDTGVQHEPGATGSATPGTTTTTTTTTTVSGGGNGPGITVDDLGPRTADTHDAIYEPF